MIVRNLWTCWLKCACLLCVVVGTAASVQATETVILLHGLARSAKSMSKIEKKVTEAGYRVVNIDYPSTEYPIEELAKQIHATVQLESESATRVHFVTHSMGGILVRYMESRWPIGNIGRVVMLSPPNQGSEVVDRLGDYALFKRINGPAGQQLGKEGGSLLPALPPVDFELGVITGDRSINWILSSMIPGTDDGKVSIESARVEGMKAFKVVHATHPMIMNNGSVIEDILSFLARGHFTD